MLRLRLVISGTHGLALQGIESATLQERLNTRLAAAWAAWPALRPALRVAMAAVGSGGPGDLGQRIRDDILAIQSANGAKVSQGFDE